MKVFVHAVVQYVAYGFAGAAAVAYLIMAIAPFLAHNKEEE